MTPLASDNLSLVLFPFHTFANIPHFITFRVDWPRVQPDASEAMHQPLPQHRQCNNRECSRGRQRPGEGMRLRAYRCHILSFLPHRAISMPTAVIWIGPHQDGWQVGVQVSLHLDLDPHPYMWCPGEVCLASGSKLPGLNIADISPNSRRPAANCSVTSQSRLAGPFPAPKV